jgi:hypothetical protein
MENLYSLVAVSPRIAREHYSESTGGEQPQSYGPGTDALLACYQYLLRRALERQAAEAEAAEVAGR